MLAMTIHCPINCHTVSNAKSQLEITVDMADMVSDKELSWANKQSAVIVTIGIFLFYTIRGTNDEIISSDSISFDVISSFFQVDYICRLQNCF